MARITHILLCFILININPFIFAKTAEICEESSKKSLPIDYIIGPGDVLEISVYEEEDLCKTVRVSDTGMITYPLLGRVDVKQLTTAQVEERLTNLLAKDYLVNPQVNVFVKEYSKFYVFGEVKQVGAYPLYGKLTVLEAITMAGGFTEVAAKDRVRIKRVIENGKINIITVDVDEMTKKDVKKNDIIVYPNDIIIVPESFF